MATRHAAQNGNWNSTATWVGGVVPGPGDIVRANGKTVTVNVDITVAQLRTDSGGGAGIGGLFSAGGGGFVTVTADFYAGTSVCVQAWQSKLIGNAYGGIGTSCYGVKMTSRAALFGDTQGGSGTWSAGAYVTGGCQHFGNSKGGSGNVTYGTNLVNGGSQIGNSTASGQSIGTYCGGGCQQFGAGQAWTPHSGTIVEYGGRMDVTGSTSSGSTKGVSVRQRSSGILHNGVPASDISVLTDSTTYTREEYYGDLWPAGGGAGFYNPFNSGGIR